MSSSLSSMRVLRYILLGLVLGLALAAQDAWAARRVALVVGNAKYAHAGALANTLNDAHAIATLLKRAGFDSVEEKNDLGVVEMKRALRDFAGVAANADVAVIYYSGHGIEAAGVNYLIPVDAKLANALDVEDETVPLDRLMLATSSVKSLSLIILDACRENPFVRESVTRAIATHTLTEQPTGANTLIAYAAKAGSLSYDGVGPNSPFTTALVKHIAEPGLDIRIALGQVRDDVLMATGGKQEPYVYGSLGGGTIALAPGAAAAPPAIVQADPLAGVAADYALTERVGTPEAWRAFLEAHHGGGFYAELARAQLSRLGQPAPSAVAVAAPAPPAKPAVVAEAKPAADPCDAEAARLAALRGDPEPEAVAAFAKTVTCAALKPQLNRLLESAGLAGAPTQLASRKPDAAGCEGEGRELERLRAAPDPAAVQALYARLVCPSLKPQVQRLLESLGETAKANSAKAFNSDACAAEARELARLRAEPNRSATLAFAKSLTCSALKPQAQRLLESLAD